MIPRRLSSLQHPLVKQLVKLRESRSFRRERQLVLITGRTLVQDVATHSPLKILISTAPLSLPAEETFLATPEILKKIMGLPTHDLVAAVVPLPPPATLDQKNRIVVLENISDPGNVGTLLRTALALGWEGAFLTPSTADPFNDKALRSARGAPLFLPIRQGSLPELQQLIHANSLSVYIADVHGQNLSETVFKTPLALILGHETEGPSPEAKALGKTVAIPMRPEMESLNVASAAAILIYQIGLK